MATTGVVRLTGEALQNTLQRWNAIQNYMPNTWRLPSAVLEAAPAMWYMKGTRLTEKRRVEDLTLCPFDRLKNHPMIKHSLQTWWWALTEIKDELQTSRNIIILTTIIGSHWFRRFAENGRLNREKILNKTKEESMIVEKSCATWFLNRSIRHYGWTISKDVIRKISIIQGEKFRKTFWKQISKSSYKRCLGIL